MTNSYCHNWKYNFFITSHDSSLKGVRKLHFYVPIGTLVKMLRRLAEIHRWLIWVSMYRYCSTWNDAYYWIFAWDATRRQVCNVTAETPKACSQKLTLKLKRFRSFSGKCFRFFPLCFWCFLSAFFQNKAGITPEKSGNILRKKGGIF